MALEWLECPKCGEKWTASKRKNANPEADVYVCRYCPKCGKLNVKLLDEVE